MKTKLIGIIICITLVTLSIFPIATTEEIKITGKTHDFVQGEIIIKIKEGIIFEIFDETPFVITSLASINILNQQFKVYEIESTILSTFIPNDMKLIKSIGIDRIYTFKIEKGINVLDVCKAYSKNEYVEYAEPNYLGQGCLTPNDTNFNLQWGLHNTGQTGGTSDADIDAPEAWDLEIGEQGVKIAIIDSGIEWTHTDLSNRIWINYGDPINGVDDDGNGLIDDYRGWDFVNNDNNPNDDHYNSHGTHCSGIAGAATNNNIGIAGVDWNCKLMAIKSMKSNNLISWTDAAEGLTYAADMGADIISMSWSGTGSNQSLKDAIDYAYGKGCILVAASGNYDSSYPYIPAKYSNTIAVGATEDDDTRWEDSNYGNHLDLVAPGVDIYSTKRSNNYGYLTGTSMATPMVAAAAALLKAQDHTYTQTQIRTILTMTADDQVGKPSEDTPGFDIYHGNGRLNLYKALYGAPLKPSNPSGETNGKKGKEYTYTTMTNDPNGDDLYYWFDWGDGNNSGWVGSYASGQQASAKHKWSESGDYKIKVKAKDTDGKESEWSDLLPITMPKSKSPIFNFPLLNWLFECFPNLFPIFRYLLEIYIY